MGNDGKNESRQGGRSYQEALALNRAGVRPEQGAQKRPAQSGAAQRQPQGLVAGRAPGPSGPLDAAEAAFERKYQREGDSIKVKTSTTTTKLILLAGLAGVGLAGLLHFRQVTAASQLRRDPGNPSSYASKSVTGLGLSAAGMGPQATEDGGPPCEPTEELRTMGTQWLEPSAYGSVPMTIRNKTNHIAFVDMRMIGSMEQATTLVIMPGEAIRFPLAGKGAVGSASVGALWCNRKVGWQDGRKTDLRPAMIVSRDTTEIKAILLDRSSNMVAFRVFAEKHDSQAPAHFQ